MNIIQIAFLNFGYFQQFQMSYILSTYPTHIDYILSHYRWDYEYHVLYMYIYTRTEYYSQSKKIFRQWMENCIRGTGLLCGKVETVVLNINLLFFLFIFCSLRFLFATDFIWYCNYIVNFLYTLKDKDRCHLFGILSLKNAVL